MNNGFEEINKLQKTMAYEGGPVCPNCGKPLAKGDAFCDGCGTKIDNQGEA